MKERNVIIITHIFLLLNILLLYLD